MKLFFNKLLEETPRDGIASAANMVSGMMVTLMAHHRLASLVTVLLTALITMSVTVMMDNACVSHVMQVKNATSATRALQI